MTASELMRAQPGTPAYDELKLKVIAGDNAAARDFVLSAAWANLRRHPELGDKKRVELFRALMDSPSFRVITRV